MSLNSIVLGRPLVVLDCETTSVNIKDARVIQLAMTKLLPVEEGDHDIDFMGD